jgi:hypothetical protein
MVLLHTVADWFDASRIGRTSHCATRRGEGE